MSDEQFELLISMFADLQTSGQADDVISRMDELLSSCGSLLTRQEELLAVLGNMQGYLIFFVTVILLFFVYRFFRMFF